MHVSSSTWILAAAAALLMAGPAWAQATEGEEEVEIDRPVDDLEATLADPVDPDDPNAVDTGLVFTSTGVRTAVHCVARDHEGARVGGAFAWVPPRGARLILASDFSDGERFAGSVACHSVGAVVGSAILVGPRGATDLEARHDRTRISPRKAKKRVFRTNVFFPVVATR